MKLVLDTNVIISAFINPAGNPSQILKLAINRKARLCYNTVILYEYESVMKRPKFSNRIDPKAVSRFIDLIRSIGISYSPVPGNKTLPDESDRIFYDTAKETGSVLVTGNLKHFPQEPFIISPADFMRRFGG